MEELNKSIDAFIDDLFSEDIEKSENFEVASASKTTADKVMAEVPKSEKDEGRDAGRPKDDHDVPESDEDGEKAKGYESVQKDQAAVEPSEDKQAHAVTQISAEGHMGEKAKMRDPRLSKSEYEEFVEFKKAKAAAQEKQTEDLRKAEQTRLVKSAVEEAIAPLRKENEQLKKSLSEQGALIKAVAGLPRQSKSITHIEALEKSADRSQAQGGEFSKSEKMDAAEALVKAGKIPMEAAIELSSTNSIHNIHHRNLVEQFLLGSSK